MKYYSAIKKKEVLSSGTTWMAIEDIMLSQTHKHREPHDGCQGWENGEMLVERYNIPVIRWILWPCTRVSNTVSHTWKLSRGQILNVLTTTHTEVNYMRWWTLINFIVVINSQYIHNQIITLYNLNLYNIIFSYSSRKLKKRGRVSFLEQNNVFKVTERHNHHCSTYLYARPISFNPHNSPPSVFVYGRGNWSWEDRLLVQALNW